MVAIDKGFFKEQGLDIEYQVILNSSDRLASVDAGSSAFSNLGRSSDHSGDGTRRHQLLLLLQLR